MKLHFTKMHGLGNDFMVVNGIEHDFHFTPEIITRLADRRRGVGFDQLLLLEASQDPEIDFVYRVFNADGSEVSQCGNGARCIARFIDEKKLSPRKHFRVSTKTGILELRLQDDGWISVNMGVPQWNPAKIPFDAQSQNLRYSLKTSQGTIMIGAVSMGNPHAVIQVKDVSVAPVNTLGAEIESHSNFPERVNVGFMQIVDRTHIQLRVYERGAGETLACGSGACAAVSVGRAWGLLDETVRVSLPGGDLEIYWPGGDAMLWMRGPATTVFEGVVEIT